MRKNPTHGGHYHAFFRREGSRKLLILFSHLARRPPSFAWYRMAADLEANLLFLNSEGQDWYRAGIRQFAPEDGLRHTVRAVALIAQSIGPNTEIYTAGASMGGYGALLYGSLLDARGIFSCAAETILGLPGGRSSALRPSRWSHVYPDLKALPPSSSNRYVVYGEMHLVDTLCAANLYCSPTTTLSSVHSGDHGVSDTLAGRGQLLPALQTLIDGGEPMAGIYDSGLAASPDLDQLWHLNWLMETKDHGDAARLALSLRDRFGSHPLLAFSAGLALFHLRRDEEALREFETASVRATQFAPLELYVGVIKTRNGGLTEGISALRRAIAIDPKPSLVHFQLGMALEKAGFEAEAAKCFRQALARNPDHPAYVKKVSEIQVSGL